jgi:hypothetical protein
MSSNLHDNSTKCLQLFLDDEKECAAQNSQFTVTVQAGERGERSPLSDSNTIAALQPPRAASPTVGDLGAT